MNISTISYRTNTPSRQKNSLALNDLHDILGQITEVILKAEEKRKRLELELRSAHRTSYRVNYRDLIPYLSSHTDVVDHAIYEWFGENPKGKINKESFEKQIGSTNNSSIINKTYFKRMQEHSKLESLKKSNTATISHEGIGLDQAAQIIIKEYLNPNSMHEESEIIEAICNFMIKYPRAARDFRKEVRSLVEQEKRIEINRLINDLKDDLDGTVSEIKEKYDFAQLLFKQQIFSIKINKKTLLLRALINRILREKNQKVRMEMLKTVHQEVQE